MARPFTRRRAVTAIVAAAAVVAIGMVHRGVARAAPNLACPSEPTALLLVDTANHKLAMCEHGRPTSTFTVRLGRKGTGKKHEGDQKTPLGVYPLGEPRASVSYGTFVPVAYPTPEQRGAGYTGGAIGVHGPDRRLRSVGALANVFDTTDGCIGVATDDEIAQIAGWTRARKVTAIVLK